MLSVSVLPGMKGAEGTNSSVERAERCQDPATAGCSVGSAAPVGVAPGSGAVKCTAIVVSEATPLVPLAGETAATAKAGVALPPALAAPVVDVVVPAPELGEPARLLAYQAPPAASARTTTAAVTHGQIRRRRGP